MMIFLSCFLVIHFLYLVSSYKITDDYSKEEMIHFPDNVFPNLILDQSSKDRIFKNIDDGPKYHLVTREMWGALPPRSTTPLEHPVPLVIIMHTATPTCTDSCSERVSSIQSYHMGHLRLPDITYNFLIGGDGDVYEGRGWDTENAARGHSISISFIGNYLFDNLTPQMISAAQDLLEYGVQSKKLSDDYTLVCHNQTTRTESPGPNVYKIVKTWPHFKPGPAL